MASPTSQATQAAGPDSPALNNTAGPAASQPPSRRSLLQRLELGASILLVLCTGLTVMTLGVGSALGYRHYLKQGELVQSVALAGQVASVTLGNGLLSRALVQTNLGFYALSNGVNLNRNEVLTLEVRGNATRFLCDAQHRCTELS